MNGRDQTTDFDRVSSTLRDGDTEMPPLSVDAAILQEAADAMNSGRARSRNWQRWLISGALAATLVLSVSLTVNLMVPQTPLLSTLSRQQMNEVTSEPGRAQPATRPPAIDEESRTDLSRYRIVPADSQAQSTASRTRDGGDTEEEARPPDTLERESGTFSNAGNSASDEELIRPADLLARTAPVASGATAGDTTDRHASQSELVSSGSQIKRAEVQDPSTEDWQALGAANRSDLPGERFSMMTKADRYELKKLVEAQQEKDRQEFLATYLESDAYREAVTDHPERWLADIADLIEMGEFVFARNELEEFVIAYPDYELDERFQF